MLKSALAPLRSGFLALPSDSAVTPRRFATHLLPGRLRLVHGLSQLVVDGGELVLDAVAAVLAAEGRQHLGGLLALAVAEQPAVKPKGVSTSRRTVRVGVCLCALTHQRGDSGTSQASMHCSTAGTITANCT